MTTRSDALALAERAQAALDPIEDLTVTATTAAPDAVAALHAGDLVVLVKPPRVEFLTWDVSEATWTVIVATGPTDDHDTAWDRLDEARDALVLPLEVDTADPGTLRDAQGAEWPALTLTLTTQH